jgi:hypothetical protein
MKSLNRSVGSVPGSKLMEACSSVSGTVSLKPQSPSDPSSDVFGKVGTGSQMLLFDGR